MCLASSLPPGWEVFLSFEVYISFRGLHATLQRNVRSGWGSAFGSTWRGTRIGCNHHRSATVCRKVVARYGDAASSGGNVVQRGRGCGSLKVWSPHSMTSCSFTQPSLTVVVMTATPIMFTIQRWHHLKLIVSYDQHWQQSPPPPPPKKKKSKINK